MAGRSALPSEPPRSTCMTSTRPNTPQLAAPNHNTPNAGHSYVQLLSQTPTLTGKRKRDPDSSTQDRPPHTCPQPTPGQVNRVDSLMQEPLLDTPHTDSYKSGMWGDHEDAHSSLGPAAQSVSSAGRQPWQTRDLFGAKLGPDNGGAEGSGRGHADGYKEASAPSPPRLLDSGAQQHIHEAAQPERRLSLEPLATGSPNGALCRLTAAALLNLHGHGGAREANEGGMGNGVGSVVERLAGPLAREGSATTDLLLRLASGGPLDEGLKPTGLERGQSASVLSLADFGGGAELVSLRSTSFTYGDGEGGEGLGLPEDTAAAMAALMNSPRAFSSGLVRCQSCDLAVCTCGGSGATSVAHWQEEAFGLEGPGGLAESEFRRGRQPSDISLGGASWLSAAPSLLAGPRPDWKEPTHTAPPLQALLPPSAVPRQASLTLPTQHFPRRSPMVGPAHQATVPALLPDAEKAAASSASPQRKRPRVLWDPELADPHDVGRALGEGPVMRSQDPALLEDQLVAMHLLLRKTAIRARGDEGGGAGEADEVRRLEEEVGARQRRAEGSCRAWPAQDKAKFVEGMFAFGRNFAKIRASLLPHRSHKELVAYYYSCFKGSPNHHQWKANHTVARKEPWTQPATKGSFKAEPVGALLETSPQRASPGRAGPSLSPVGLDQAHLDVAPHSSSLPTHAGQPMWAGGGSDNKDQ